MEYFDFMDNEINGMELWVAKDLYIYLGNGGDANREHAR
jgi:hypothetical protein